MCLLPPSRQAGLQLDCTPDDSSSGTPGSRGHSRMRSRLFLPERLLPPHSCEQRGALLSGKVGTWRTENQFLVCGIKPHVVISGFMEPETPVGSLVLARARPAVQVEIGDIVTVQQQQHNGGGFATYRAGRTATNDNGQILPTLKGDANQTDDPLPYAVAAVALVALVFVAAVLIRPRQRAEEAAPPTKAIDFGAGMERHPCNDPQLATAQNTRTRAADCA